MAILQVSTPQVVEAALRALGAQERRVVQATITQPATKRVAAAGVQAAALQRQVLQVGLMAAPEAKAPLAPGAVQEA